MIAELAWSRLDNLENFHRKDEPVTAVAAVAGAVAGHISLSSCFSNLLIFAGWCSVSRMGWRENCRTTTCWDCKHDDLLQEVSLNPVVVEGSQADPLAARTVPFCGQLRSCVVDTGSSSSRHGDSWRVETNHPLQVQSKVLPKYGFGGDLKGVFDMLEPPFWWAAWWRD